MTMNFLSVVRCYGCNEVEGGGRGVAEVEGGQTQFRRIGYIESSKE